jgi:hypothetical protein
MEEQKHPKGSGKGGEYTRLPARFREKLSKPMSEEAIGKHPSMSWLSTIKSIYVVERLNDLFGCSGWDLETDIVNEEVLVHTVKGKPVDYKHVVVCGRIYFREYDLYGPVQFGGHDDKVENMANAYKGAVTDCLSKCASLIEIGIQVFKGNPDDRSSVNKSKRIDEHEEIKKPEAPTPEVADDDMGDDASPEGMAKPKLDPVEEPEVDAQMEALKELHVELFGKKANANSKKETLKKKVEKEIAKRKAAEAEEAEEVEVEEVDEVDPYEADMPTEEEVEEVEAEVVKDYDYFVRKAAQYTTKAALAADAKPILKEAEEAGLDKDDLSGLKGHINNVYSNLD